MTELNWDIKLSLALAGLALLALVAWTIGPPMKRWISRLIWWHRVKPYSACYITYRENVRVSR